MITCPNCGEENGNDRTTCFKCHQPLPKPKSSPVSVNSSLLKETKSTSAPMITSSALKVIAWVSLVLFVIVGFFEFVFSPDVASGFGVFLAYIVSGGASFVFWGVLSSILYHLENRK